MEQHALRATTRTLEGGYKHKYLKYKQKYFELKKIFRINLS